VAKSSFSLKVIDIIRAIPVGKVTTNGSVACGRQSSSRTAGRACSACLLSHDLNNKERSDCSERSFIVCIVEEGWSSVL